MLEEMLLRIDCKIWLTLIIFSFLIRLTL